MKKSFNLTLTALLFVLCVQGALTQCTAGQYDVNGTCEACPSNTFSTTTDALTCNDCVNCQSCNPANGDCTVCNAGFQPSGQNCQACPANTFSSNGNGACQSCSGCSSCNAVSGVC